MLEPAQKYDAEVKLRLIPDIIPGWKTIVTLVSITVFFGFSIWWLNKNPALQGLWNSFNIDKRIPASFCEQVHLNNPVRQPVNTFSNIIYLVIAIVVLKTSWEERFKRNSHDLVTVNTVYGFLFGLILLYVFFASSFYHTSLINIAHKLDYSAVFAFSLFPIIFFLHRRYLNHNSKLLAAQKRKLTIVFFSTYLLANLLLAFLIPRGKESLTALILIQIFLGLAFFAAIDKSGKQGRFYLALSIVSVLIAFIWFEFDKYKILCRPNSYFQPHSLWNLFIGLSAYNFYLYIRSEPDSGTLVIKMKQKE